VLVVSWYWRERATSPWEHRKRQTAERLRAGDSWTDLDLVFTTRHGTPIERTEDWRAWKAILHQAQVRDARVHDARHTAATLLIAQGVHIRVVQEVLGHTRVTTTERYTHVVTLQMKDASERMDQALWARDEGNCNPNCNPGLCSVSDPPSQNLRGGR
jgi:site-specific recombinase XerD